MQAKTASTQDGNWQKYRNPNPLQRVLIRRFLRTVGCLVEATGSQTLADIGCAEGFVIRYLQYDKEADVLYVSFRKPQQAKDSVMEDSVVYHYDGDELVGVTVIGARTMFGQVKEQSAA